MMRKLLINAFFNLIKDIKINNKYRFILIKKEEKEKKINRISNNCLHQYYIKDVNNNPRYKRKNLWWFNI